MGQRGVFVPIDKATLAELYRDRGLSLREIADELETSTMTVRRRMKEYGIGQRNPGTRPAHGDQAHRAAEVLTPRFLRRPTCAEG
jgi:hypothetical protein